MPIDTIYIKLGQQVRKLRQERKLSQETLALEAGIDRVYISAIERAKKHPSITTLAKIAAVLNVEVSDLFMFTEQRNE